MKPMLLAVILCFAALTTAHATALDEAMLRVHNAERAAIGVPPLRWSEALARDAATWAAELARRGQMQHADRHHNPNEGENLWTGTTAAYSYDQMAQGWAEEKRYFRNGAFPHVTKSGDWHAVGHYTQMIWRATTEIGCAVATGRAWDILVCRYSPAGNFIGETPY